MNISFPFAGEILSLLSALFWAFAIVMMKKIGDRIHPITMNLIKNSIGFILITNTLYFMGMPIINPEFVEKEDYIRLIISGIIGIGLGDIIFFRAK